MQKVAVRLHLLFQTSAKTLEEGQVENQSWTYCWGSFCPNPSSETILYEFFQIYILANHTDTKFYIEKKRLFWMDTFSYMFRTLCPELLGASKSSSIDDRAF